MLKTVEKAEERAKQKRREREEIAATATDKSSRRNSNLNQDRHRHFSTTSNHHMTPSISSSPSSIRKTNDLCHISGDSSSHKPFHERSLNSKPKEPFSGGSSDGTNFSVLNREQLGDESAQGGRKYQPYPLKNPSRSQSSGYKPRGPLNGDSIEDSVLNQERLGRELAQGETHQPYPLKNASSFSSHQPEATSAEHLISTQPIDSYQAMHQTNPEEYTLPLQHQHFLLLIRSMIQEQIPQFMTMMAQNHPQQYQAGYTYNL